MLLLSSLFRRLSSTSDRIDAVEALPPKTDAAEVLIEQMIERRDSVSMEATMKIDRYPRVEFDSSSG
jgi:hypothetical protein